MLQLTFEVPTISCGHCVKAITEETQAAGVQEVLVDLDSKRVFVSFDEEQVSLEEVKEAIVEAGYEITGQLEGKQIPTVKKVSMNLRSM